MIRVITVLLMIVSVNVHAEFDFSSVENVEKEKLHNKELDRLSAIEKAKSQTLIDQRNRKAKYKQNRLVYADKRADKMRDQQYEDELRALNLKTLKAKADRTNDYIDSELATENAKTDVILSIADKTRSEGKADIIRAEKATDIEIVIVESK